MLSTPQTPQPGSLRDLTTGLAALTKQLHVLSQDDPGRPHVLHGYQALHQQIGAARAGLRPLTSNDTL